MRYLEYEEDRATASRPRSPEPETDGPGSMDRRELRVDDRRGRESTDELLRSRPWGFWLVLAAIVVVALMYSVTMVVLRGQIAPSTAIGAMSAAFAVIGTLVGTYFGIKAGLDGQDKVKETVTRAIRGDAEQRQRERSRGAVEGRRDHQRSQEQQRGERERRERGERERREPGDNEGL